MQEGLGQGGRQPPPASQEETVADGIYMNNCRSHCLLAEGEPPAGGERMRSAKREDGGRGRRGKGFNSQRRRGVDLTG